MSGWPGGAGAAGVISATVAVAVVVVGMTINKTNTLLRNRVYCLDIVFLRPVEFMDSQFLFVLYIGDRG